MSTNFWNEVTNNYNDTYDKFKEFLDGYNFLEFLKEFRKRFMPMNIWMSLDDFIVFVYGKVENDFKIYCKDNNLSDEECDLLIRIESKDFWDKYIRNKKEKVR